MEGQYVKVGWVSGVKSIGRAFDYCYQVNSIGSRIMLETISGHVCEGFST